MSLYNSPANKTLDKLGQALKPTEKGIDNGARQLSTPEIR
jgi:hypothetical protein